MNSEKGITLITLVITIIVLMILTFTISVNIEDYTLRRAKNEFETDLLRLNEEINQYYSREKKLPIINKYNNEVIEEIPKNSNDNENYYVIDISKLNVELNYGNGYENVKQKELTEEITDVKDIYIINEQSHTIYYPKGIEYEEQINYTIADEYTKIQDVSVIEILRNNSIYVKEKKTIKDQNGNKVVIPEGFKIAKDSGLTVDEGIIIEDNDIIEGIGENRGNQYVWIPVGTEIKKNDNTTVNITLGRYLFADGTNDMAENGTTVLEKGTPVLKQSAENYIEETLLKTQISEFKEIANFRTGVLSEGLDGLNTTALNLKGFIDSTKENGGYYIARYEASYGEDGKVNSKISNSYSDSTEPTSEGTLWNFITQIDASKACRRLYTTVNTDLINSYAWDTAIVYIQEFSNDTDYSYQTSINSSLGNTGKNADELCKINDMASNIREWTTEYSTRIDETTSKCAPCTYRGDDVQYDYYTSYRSDNTSTTKSWYGTFRCILYIN